MTPISMQPSVSKISGNKLGPALLGMIFVITGIWVAREGYLQIKELWYQFAPYLPFSLPADFGQKSQNYLPFIFLVFIRLVSSLSGILIGLLWFFSGLGEVLNVFRKKKTSPGSLDSTEIVAESVVTGKLIRAKRKSWLHVIPDSWRLNNFSTIDISFSKALLVSSVKIFLVGIVIALITEFIQLTPLLLNKIFQVNPVFAVPSPSQLYVLLFAVIIINFILLITFFFTGKARFTRNSQDISVTGFGDPNLLFALLEEASTLLNPKGAQTLQHTRLEKKDASDHRISLVETNPAGQPGLGKPAGYLALPFVVAPIILGFSKLINFSKPVDPVPYTEFFQLYIMNYVLEVLFAVALIMAGLYFADWSRRFFEVERFRSNLLVFEIAGESGSAKASTESALETPWGPQSESSNHFAAWVKDPSAEKALKLTAYWGEAKTESLRSGSPRYIVSMNSSKELDEAVTRLLPVPFNTRFSMGKSQKADAELNNSSL